jgi:hypothetical protein
MTRVDEFNSFYSSTFADALQVTYAVSGDRVVAFEATVDAYRRAWRDWSKIRDRNPLSYVRNEAWKLTSLSRSTHPLRRRHEEDSDTELLGALHDLSADDRRLIVLMTLGNTDLEEASREVGLPAEEGIENVTTALTTLEAALGESIDAIERRMHALAAATQHLEVPTAATVRTAARRGRQRNTILLVAAAVVLILTGGLVATDGDALATSADLPRREKIGAETVAVVLDSEKIDASRLLAPRQLATLDGTRTWKTESTDESVKNTTPYATCPTKRFADPDPLKVFVRTFTGNGVGNARVAQAIEVSSSPKVAEEAYQRLVQWYSDCEHPRVQLVAAYTVERPFGDFQILSLRSHRSPERSFTVGFSHSGTITSTLVHEVDGGEGPSIESFARALNASVAKVCKDSGGRCSDAVQVVRTDPPPTTESPSFLGVVDLPPIADVDQVWAGAPSPPETPNPAATQCDQATYSGKSVVSTASRLYVLYQALELPRELPEEFGVAETTARFSSEKKAKAFTDRLAARVDSCSTEVLNAKVDERRKVKLKEASGVVWRVGFEVAGGNQVYFRTAIVRRGADVAQVTFTPSGKYDITQGEFTAIARRAATRLKYAG